MTDEWASGMLTVDGFVSVAGQYRTDERWNGWLLVRLPRESALIVVDALAPHLIGSRLETAEGVIREVSDEGWVDEWIESPDGTYDLGSGAWCWSLSEDGE